MNQGLVNMNQEMIAHLQQSLNKGKRYDGRGLLDYRDPIKVEYGVTRNAEGSARVQIGDTVVIAGVKLAVETPYPDSPEQGNIMVNAELLPLSNPAFETGHPGIQAIELARVTDRGIREAKAIDVKQLVIKAGEKVWSVMIDLIPLNDAGNLFDVMGLAALAALKDARFPKYNEELNEINYKELTDKKIPLVKEPIQVTVIKIGEHLLVDPVMEEEAAYDARLTVTTTQDGIISALQKGGEEPLTVDEIMAMVKIGMDKGQFLRGKL